MCDTFVALPSATAEKSVILAKNADCQVNEAHALIRLPKKTHLPGELLLATHCVIPQAELTHDVILSKSFWTWGGEIGLNEYGVAIGNEAVYSTLMQAEKYDGLITMDLLRLGLERATTAREAVTVIGEAVSKYGQGGNCELAGNSHFDSSFLISDTTEAWVVETAGREWAAKQVGPVASISNAYTIDADWDLCSLADQNPEINWSESVADLKPIESIGSVERQQITCTFLEKIGTGITIRDAFNLLRNHPEGYHPATAQGHAICMHAGPGASRLWNACGAMASEVSPDGSIGWFTGTSGTCVSIFKPLFPGIDLPNMGSLPTETFEPQSLWWIGELLHRRAMADFDGAAAEIRREIEALEDRFIIEAQSVIKGTAREKQQFSEACFQRASELTMSWVYQLAGRSSLYFEDKDYGEAWDRFNREAGLTGMPGVKCQNS